MKAHHHATKIMGCGFVITAVNHDAQIAWDAIRAAESEMRRIEELISSWKTESETTLINNAAGFSAIKVSEELFSLIERSKNISKLTCGSFDISGSLSRYYWNFNKEENPWLEESKIIELRSLIDYNSIKLFAETQEICLEKEGMKIGFGGIGKGYAAERAKQIMQQVGIEHGLVNASGDLLCWGNPPNAEDWNINIPDPRNRAKNLLKIGISQGSVVTSGSFENFTLVNGRRYSHIINPRTGEPVSHTKNVTVVCPNAEFADAMATALSVLPIEEGIALINQLNGVECIIIDAEDKIFFSNQLKQNAYA